MQRVLRINRKINQSPVGQKEASSQELTILVSARPPAGDFIYIRRQYV